MTTNKNDKGVIEESFWYSTPERKHLLLGKNRYSEVDAAYAAMSEEEKDKARSEIPLLSSIRWSGRFLEWKEYLAAHGGDYPTKSKDTLRLANWVQENRRTLQKGKLSDERKALLDQVDSLWHMGIIARGGKPKTGPLTPSPQWHQRLKDYSSFIAVHGRIPSQYSQDPEERSLQMWMMNQKHRLQESTYDTTEAYALINEAVPEHLYTKRRRISWDEALELFANFMATYESFPSSVSDDPDERFLGKWIMTQREPRTTKRDLKHTERAGKLDAVFPQWRNSQFFNEREWNEMLELLSTHVTKTGRMPSTTVPEEKRVAVWRGAQMTLWKSGNLKPHRLAMLNEKVPGWNKKFPRNQHSSRV